MCNACRFVCCALDTHDECGCIDAARLSVGLGVNDVATTATIRTTVVTTEFPGLGHVDVGEETQHVACNEKGCTVLPTIRCVFPDGADGGYYCQIHCEGAGFCYVCGQFWAGIDSFDFALPRGGIKGVCENCTDQIKADAGEYDLDDDDGYDEETQPTDLP